MVAGIIVPFGGLCAGLLIWLSNNPRTGLAFAIRTRGADWAIFVRIRYNKRVRRTLHRHPAEEMKVYGPLHCPDL
jgi:hypothetical protein